MINFNFEWNISQLLSWIYVLPSSKLWLIEEERQHQCSKNPSDKGRGSSLHYHSIWWVLLWWRWWTSGTSFFTIIVPDQWSLEEHQSKHTRHRTWCVILFWPNLGNCLWIFCFWLPNSLDRFDTTWHGLVRFFYGALQKETIRNYSWTKNSFYGFGLIAYKKQDKRLTILKTMGLILRYIREKLCQLAFVTLNSAKFIEALKGDQNSIYYSN